MPDSMGFSARGEMCVDTNCVGRNDKIKICPDDGYGCIIADAQPDIRPTTRLSGEKLLDQGKLIHGNALTVTQRNALEALSRIAFM
jgi:hypothetical protein